MLRACCLKYDFSHSPEAREKEAKSQLQRLEADSAATGASSKELNSKLQDLGEERREALRLLSERNVKLLSLNG